MRKEPLKTATVPTSRRALPAVGTRPTLLRVEAALQRAEREAREYTRESRFCDPYDNSPKNADPWNRRDTRL